MRLILKKEWPGFVVKDRQTKATRTKIPAGEHVVERVMQRSLSYRNTRNPSLTTVTLSRGREEPWLMLKNTTMGAPESFWRQWKNGQPNFFEEDDCDSDGDNACPVENDSNETSFDGTEYETTKWGDYAVEIIEDEGSA